MKSKRRDNKTVSDELVSVILLSHNRKDELRSGLRAVLSQGYSNIEVIVVDNASTDGTDEMIRDEFPRIKLLVLPQNIGVAGRRKGAEIAKGAIIVMYDDDSSPANKDDITCIVEFFNANLEASAVCTNIYRKRSGYYETKGWERYAIGGNHKKGFEGLFIHTSGTAFRKKHFLDSEAFKSGFWGDQEFEASLNLLAHGYRIFYLPSITTNHRASLLNRRKERYFRYATRNHLLTIYKYFRFPKVWEYSIKEIFYQLLLSRKYFFYTLMGIFDYLRYLFLIRPERYTITADFNDYLEQGVQKRRYPGLLFWYKRQLKAREYRKSLETKGKKPETIEKKK